MCVNNLPRVALDSGVAGIRTPDLLIASPASYRYATKPHMLHYELHNTDQLRRML